MQEAPASNTPSDAASSNGVATASGINRLKKMSTTAGLGSGDYAAVNTLSVVAIAGALLSILALLTDLLLIIPVLTLVSGIVALRQIGASNGTQTGRGLAVVAILISLGIASYVVGGRVYRSVVNKPDQEQLVALVAELKNKITSKDYAGAYKLTSPQFQSRVKEKDFVAAFAAFEANADTVGIADMQWNGTPIEYQDDKESRIKSARMGLIMSYRSSLPPNRVEVEFLRQDGKWALNNMQALFK